MLGQLWGRLQQSPLMRAYVWYLIASGKISQAGKNVSESLSADELLQAELMAADWLEKSREVISPRMKNATIRPPRTNADGSSA